MGQNLWKLLQFQLTWDPKVMVFENDLKLFFKQKKKERVRVGCQQVFFSHETNTDVDYNPAWWSQVENICCDSERSWLIENIGLCVSGAWLIYGLKLILSFIYSLVWNVWILFFLFVCRFYKVVQELNHCITNSAFKGKMDFILFYL